MNIGEEIAAAYLQVIKKCEFIQLNLQTPDVQGEIDVIGIDLSERRIYLCEVAVHLTSGLRYVRDKRPNTVAKLTEKFTRDIEYAERYFPDYTRHYMLWSPVVKDAREGAKENQIAFVKEIQDRIRMALDIEIESVINQDFQCRLSELREYAGRQTEELKSPVLRYLQIEQYLTSHLEHMKRADRRQRRAAIEPPSLVPGTDSTYAVE